jgi:hypothetical protein
MPSHDFVGVDTPTTIYVDIASRAAFDKIALDMTDHGENPEDGHVISKSLCQNGVTVTFQYWVVPNSKQKEQALKARKVYDESAKGSNKLLDAVMENLQLKNDAALCRVLEVAPPVVSKLRHGSLHIGPSMLIRMHEETGLSIREMKSYLTSGTN